MMDFDRRAVLGAGMAVAASVTFGPIGEACVTGSVTPTPTPTTPTSDNGAILSAFWQYTGANTLVLHSATTVVPAVPTVAGSQTINLWIGLQNAASTSVLKAVLQYSASAGTWQLLTQLVQNGAVTLQSTPVAVTPGTTVNPVITCTSLASGAYAYQAAFQGYNTTVLGISNQPVYPIALVEMDVTGMQFCQNYPSGQTVWQNITENQGTPGTAGTNTTPTWTPSQSASDCGLGIAINSSTAITFVY